MGCKVYWQRCSFKPSLKLLLHVIHFYTLISFQFPPYKNRHGNLESLILLFKKLKIRYCPSTAYLQTNGTVTWKMLKCFLKFCMCNILPYPITHGSLKDYNGPQCCRFLSCYLSFSATISLCKKNKQGNTAMYNKIKLLRVRKTANVSHL